MNTIVNYLELQNTKQPNQNALIYLSYPDGESDERMERTITWHELYTQSRNYALNFLHNGITKNSRVVIIAEQNPETLFALYGTLLLGAIFVLVPAPTDESKMERLLSTIHSCEAQHLVVQNSISAQLSAQLEDSIQIIETTSIQAQEGELPTISIKPDDVAFLQYTSGSLSQPKGVMITHKTILSALRIEAEQYPMDENDIFVSWIPYFHTMELMAGFLLSLFTGRTHVTLNTDSFLEKPARYYQVLSDYKATITIAPASSYVESLNGLTTDTLDLSSIRFLLSAAEPVYKRQVDCIYENLSKYNLKTDTFYSGVGMTEVPTMFTKTSKELTTITLNSSEFRNGVIKEADSSQKNKILLTSAGIPNQEITVKIVNPSTLKECAPNTIGEIWYQGDLIASGYWNMDEETHNLFHATLEGYDGFFFRSGDMGFLKDNHLYLTGRSKECIIINGKNIFANDIEQTIRKNIASLEHVVLKVAAISTEEREQIIIAIENNQYDNMKELITSVNHVIKQYYHVSAFDIFFTPENGIPRTDNGKLSSARLKDAYENHSLEILSHLKTEHKKVEHVTFSEIAASIKEIFEEILHVTCTSPKDDFYELGGTSLTLVQAIKQIKKRYHVMIPIDYVVEDTSIEHLERYVVENI